MDSESIYEYAKVSQTYTHHAMLAGWRGLALVSNLSHVPSVLQRCIHFTLSRLVFVYFKIYFKKWHHATASLETNVRCTVVVIDCFFK